MPIVVLLLIVAHPCFETHHFLEVLVSSTLCSRLCMVCTMLACQQRVKMLLSLGIEMYQLGFPKCVAHFTLHLATSCSPVTSSLLVVRRNILGHPMLIVFAKLLTQCCLPSHQARCTLFSSFLIFYNSFPPKRGQFPCFSQPPRRRVYSLQNDSKSLCAIFPSLIFMQRQKIRINSYNLTPHCKSFKGIDLIPHLHLRVIKHILSIIVIE